MALHLEVAEKELQYDFSRIAILEMINTYEQEILRSQQSLTELQTNKVNFKTKDKAKKRAKIRGWQHATRNYLNTLDHFLFVMDSGVSIDFIISKQNKIIILVGEQPIIISGPNSGSDKQIEHNIVEQFCIIYDCREYFQKSDADNSLINTKPLYNEITGSWTIHSDLKAEFITSDNLIFKFSNIQERKKKELWAVGVAQELSLLLKQLKRAEQKGHIINWPTMKIHQLPLTDKAQKVMINDTEFIKSSLPLISKEQSLFTILKPRLKSDLKNNFEKNMDNHIIVNQADIYFKR
ncbi:MAG: hypothetical protein OQL19_02820 [Gammaproteobacteria bacterium]|nr:hypothetical protein [Gammaproteobacteria bacterium]